MPWYRTGTVAITAGQTTVTGTGTNFALNSRVGDAFQGPDGRWYEVANVASATVLSILPAYQGATVAAGAYGLAPMQGYVKESADRLRQLVDQFGSTLAVLGVAPDAPTLRTNIGAAARGDNSDITSLSALTTALSVAQGGTGGKTAADARTGLGLKRAAVADIVGAVSMSGGVPAGAIIERGSNTNGEYAKYADGTMECWVTRSDTTAIGTVLGSGFRSGGFSWVFPQPFVSAPTCHATPNATSCTGAGVGASAGNAASYVYTAPASQASTTMTIHLSARGRWF